MTDDEIDKLIYKLESHKAWDYVQEAADCIRELRARRDELQRSIDDIAMGRA